MGVEQGRCVKRTVGSNTKTMDRSEQLCRQLGTQVRRKPMHGDEKAAEHDRNCMIKHARTRYLGGQGDLVSICKTPISHIITPIIPIFNRLTKSPRPSKYRHES